MYRARITYSDGSSRTVELIARETAGGVETTLPRAVIEKPAERVDFLPEGSRAREGEEGYFALDNHLIRFCGHEDAVYEPGYCHMHFYGVKTPRVCFAAVVTGLWSQHAFVVAREGGEYSIHTRFVLDGQPVEEDMKVEYTFLGADGDYNDMARVYREYQLERGGCRLMRERMNEALEYAIEGPEIRVRLAWKPVPTPVEEQTEETEPPMHIAATFERVGEIMEAVKAEGVEKAQFCLVGWNKSGHDGRWPQAFPVEEALGGEAGLRALIAKAQGMGYQIVCHTNATACYSIANRFSANLPIRNRDGSPQKNAQWSGGRAYNMCPKAGGEAYMEEDLPKVRDLGFRGIHYIDVITCVPPRRCFSSAHPCSQREYIEAMRRIARRAAQLMGGFQSEGAYDQIADVCDMVLYVDFHLFDKEHPFLDENIPLWELVYHGILLYNPATATVNHPIKDWRARLKWVEYGGHPALYIHSKFKIDGDFWMGREDITCESAEAIARTAQVIREAAREYEPIRDLQLERMERHERVAEDVFSVTYESGTRIVCNYREEAFVFEDTAIAPHGYVVLRP